MAKGKASTKVKPMGTESFGKTSEPKSVESPIANTGAVPVYRADLGESLPPQGDGQLNPKRAD